VPAPSSSSEAIPTNSNLSTNDHQTLSDVFGFIDDLAEGHHYEDISDNTPDNTPIISDAPPPTLSRKSPIQNASTENSLDSFARMPFLNPAPPPPGSNAYSNPIYAVPNPSFMGFLRNPSTISCTLKPGVSKVMDPRRWVAPRDSPAKPLHPGPNKGHGSSYDQKILTEMLPVSRPPLAHVQPLSSDPMSEEVKQMDFEPVPSAMGTRNDPSGTKGKCGIMKDAIDCFSYENADFVEAVRNPPFVPSSATLEYSEPLPPIQIPYVDPPLEFSDSASAPIDDMNLYSFSTPSPEALTIDLKTKKPDKGKRPFRRAKFPRKVSKNSSAPSMTKQLGLEPLTTPPLMSPAPSPSKPYSEYYYSESDSD
jgi:hypothetical protein